MDNRRSGQRKTGGVLRYRRGVFGASLRLARAQTEVTLIQKLKPGVSSAPTAIPSELPDNLAAWRPVVSKVRRKSGFF
jgi:hypothetical protein